jgi:hypothetical protein
MFSWSPSATSREDLLSGISLEPFATTNSDGMIQYSVQSAGTAGCTISIIDSTVEATSFGSCTIRAELEARPRWASATRDIEFSFVEPAAVQDPPGQDPPNQDPPTQSPPSQDPPGQQPPTQQPGNNSSPANIPASVVQTVLAEIDFVRAPRLVGESTVGDRIRLSKFEFESPRKILKVSYRWYICESPARVASELKSSCVMKEKAKKPSYVIKKTDSGSYLSVVVRAKTKKGMLRHLISSPTSVLE